MISIAAPNESALVHQTAGDAVNREEGTDSKASIPPSLDGLSISTTSSTQVSDNKEKTIFSELREYDNGSDFNDCSSSLSSQDSGNVFNSYAAKPCPKRSVFSQYWQKTRQKPVALRPLKSLSASDLCRSSSGSLSTRDESRENSSAGSTFDASSRSSKDSSLHSSFGTFLSCSVTTAELLEDDGVSSLYDDDDDDDDGEAQDSDATSHRPSHQPPQPPPPTHNHPMRRRSILPPAPAASPVFRATFGKTTSAARSWRKSASLTNVEEYSRSVPLNSRHKTRSMPGTRSCSSSSSLLRSPGRSCLRRNPKYSPNNTASQRTLASPPSASSLSVPSMREESPVLSRADSMTSSVSFQEAVDVRHFEPPRETYSGKGWSDYFSFETTEPI
eukprot:CAMPEP_0197178274 /NCGR_PEP_ID=MMETSP1423-20130617/3608_1 /TAXON_ID=476441 /ORGANISM="Pseudo-nitzschia heimii, Strain UNC1101" /LENGTH=387 /DNA_ID=CAMNT_0042627981 /DNA_START=534 /DNA_END=1697 /DNA_ORIENTATION=+